MFIGSLLPYQEDAVTKMVALPKMLVAYDLGLGKTVITLAAVERLRELSVVQGPVLVVVLASLKFQWAKEISKFTNSSATVVDGTKARRLKQITESQDDYLITNYESVVNDWDAISSIAFGGVVLDEATQIKGFRSKRSKKVKQLARQVPVRFALTGTPIENGRPEEIYSIMQAVDGRVLGRFDLFDDTFIVRGAFGNVERYRNLDRLHQRLSRNLIRKTQTDPDVSPYLPDTIHREPEAVPLDPKVRVAYRMVSERLIEHLEEAIATFGGSFSLAAHYGVGAATGPPSEMMGSLMSEITILRQLCSFPELVVESGNRFRDQVDAALRTGSRISGGSQTAHRLLEDDPDLREVLLGARVPKLETLTRMVRDHLDSDEDAKVVIFTTFLTSADRIQQALGGEIYSGSLNAAQKEAAKVRFQTDPETRVLVSTDAGGYGVDLPQANLLINYDLPWSAGSAVQRNGRIRRASSRWPSVVIQDLIVESSIEVRQHDLLTQKSALASAVVDGKGIDHRGGVSLSAGSLLEHLRRCQTPRIR